MNKIIFPALLALICLISCQPEIPAPGGELETLYQTWTLVAAEQDNKWDAVPEEIEDITLTLNADLTSGLSTDCNQGGGTYTVAADGSIDFNAGIITQVYCGEIGGVWERLFLFSLDAVEQFSVADDELWLWNDEVSLRFER